MVYMQEKTKVLDIVNANYWTELNHRLANLAKIEYNFNVYLGATNGPVDLKSITSSLKSFAN